MAELGVFGIGVATADPEFRTVGEKNTSVCTVNLAFNRSYQDKNNEWQTEPCFLRAQVWGARADRMAESVKKGQPIYVCGYLKQDNWEHEGQKRVSYCVNLRDFQVCLKNGKNKGNVDHHKTKPETVPASTTDNDDESMPF